MFQSLLFEKRIFIKKLQQKTTTIGAVLFILFVQMTSCLH